MAYSLTFLVEAAMGADLSADPATWAWTNITSYVRGDITVSRGKPNQAAAAEPTQATFRLANTDSRFTPWHPSSPYYGQWLRGTPVRVWLNPGTGNAIRAYCYVAKLEPVWPAGNSQYAEVNVTIAGKLRQLQQGAALKSAMYRAIRNTSPLAYWALEDGAQSTLLQAAATRSGPALTQVGRPVTLAGVVGPASGLLGSAPMTQVGPMKFAGVTGPAGSDQVVDLARGGSLQAFVSTTSTSYRIEFAFNVASLGGSFLPVFDWYAGPAVWEVLISTTLQVQWVANGGTSLALYDSTFVVDDGAWHHLRLDLSQNGSDTSLTVTLDGLVVISQPTGNPSYVPVSKLVANPGGAPSLPSSFGFGHLALWAPWSGSVDTYQAFLGWVGELASARVTRLCGEQGVPVAVTGTSTVTMGAQSVAALVSLLQECETVDQGILADGMSAGLTYVAGSARRNPPVTMALDTARRQVKLGFAPVEDDSRTRNDITATRPGGSLARAVDSSPTDPLSTVHVGVYNDQVSVNVASDDQLPHQAGWRVHLGTLTEMRIPSQTIMPSDTPEIIAAWLACDLGDRYTSANLPDQFPADGDQVLDYYVETFDKTVWKVDLTGSPASAWFTWTVQDALRGRLGLNGQYLVGAESAADASWLVVSPVLPPLTTTAQYPADFPYNIQCDGEIVQVTATAGVATDNFGRTSSSTWTTADSGQTWTNVGGSSTDHTVSSGAGRQSLAAAGATLVDWLDTGSADMAYSVDTTFGGIASAGVSPLRWAVWARATDLNNGYHALLELDTAGTVRLNIRKVVGGTTTNLTTAVVVATNSAADSYSLTISVIGSTITASANGTHSITPVSQSVTDTSITAGTLVGLSAMRVAGNTDTVTAVWDHLAVSNPQTLTVVRSINGVVKAHSAGALLALSKPGVLAL